MTLRELPEWINKFRIFPRIFIGVYIYMFYEVVQWAMSVEDLSNAQSILVSVVVGAGSAWFGLYVNSGNGNAKIEVEQRKDGSSAKYEYDESEMDRNFNPYQN